MKLAGKVALITGAGSGMGRTASSIFAAEGAAVAAVDLNEAAANETARQIATQGGKSFGLHADVSNAGDAEAMVAQTIARFGRLDVLYNNAGIEGEAAFLAQFSNEAFDRVIAVNLRGVFLGMKAALPHMIQRGGSIINTASMAATVAQKGGAAYCAAKAGVVALTKVAALEYARYNIRVNCICPGAVETPMLERLAERHGATPSQVFANVAAIGRAAAPEEIARVALFLASDDSSYATGSTFQIDGGSMLG
ncbi:MAG TPA: SDR family NAD(P)-dependent oxidoreductase [Candidatus Binataceae bacterium]|nr:SDR family NAD(P)-dependent oxidoreductase [Candidatus Binataceae bacterium]